MSMRSWLWAMLGYLVGLITGAIPFVYLGLVFMFVIALAAMAGAKEGRDAA